MGITRPRSPEGPVTPQITSGQAAWKRIQALEAEINAKRGLHRGERPIGHWNTGDPEHLKCWIAIGATFVFGRENTTSAQAYNAWLYTHGFGDIPNTIRTAASWLGRYVADGGTIPDGLAHPMSIQRWHQIKMREERKSEAAKTVSEPDEAPGPPKALGLTARQLRRAGERLKSDAQKLNEAARLIERIDLMEVVEFPPEFDNLIIAARDYIHRTRK